MSGVHGRAQEKVNRRAWPERDLLLIEGEQPIDRLGRNHVGREAGEILVREIDDLEIGKLERPRRRQLVEGRLHKLQHAEMRRHERVREDDVELLEQVLRDRLLDHGPHARRKHRVVFDNMHEQAARARTQERAIMRLEAAGLAFAVSGCASCSARRRRWRGTVRRMGKARAGRLLLHRIAPGGAAVEIDIESVIRGLAHRPVIEAGEHKDHNGGPRG